MMKSSVPRVHRRRFIQTAVGAGLALAAPPFIPGAALGKDGATPPSEKITLGGFGLGGRGAYVLKYFLEEPDVRFLAVADAKLARREAVKKIADEHYGNRDCVTYRDFHDLLDRKDIDAVLIATGPNWHALAAILSAKAGKDMYCEKPCTKTIAESLTLAEVMRRTGRIFQAGTQRRSLPHFMFAVHLAREGKLGKLEKVHAHPSGWHTNVGPSLWAPAEPEPSKEEFDWDMYLGPAAWRPYNRKHTSGGEFEQGGGMVGGGVLEWGSHCIDLCQWAADADSTAPVEYEPEIDGVQIARYASGVELVVRKEGWLGLGSCPVRFEGTTGWVEAGDSGKLALSSPALTAGRKVAEIGGYPPSYHIRNFLDCVKTREQPRANAEVACSSHIACHACNIARYLNRKMTYDPRRNEFLGDAEANRLRSEALREPWRT